MDIRLTEVKCHVQCQKAKCLSQDVHSGLEDSPRLGLRLSLEESMCCVGEAMEVLGLP